MPAFTIEHLLTQWKSCNIFPLSQHIYFKKAKKKYSDFNNWWGQKSHSYFTTIFRGSLLKKLWFWWIHTDDSHILCPDRVHGETSVATGELHLLKELQALTAVQPLSGRHTCVSASTTVSLCSVTGAVDSKVSTLTSSVGKQRMWQREREGLGPRDTVHLQKYQALTVPS